MALFLFVSAAHSLMPTSTTSPATLPSDDGWGETSNGLQMRIEPVDATTAGRAVIRCVIRNVSTAPVELIDAGVWPNHRVTLTRADGTAVPPTAVGRAADEAFAPNGPRRKAIMITLAVGTTHQSADIDLAALFELQSGRHVVQVAYENGTIRVESAERSVVVDAH